MRDWRRSLRNVWLSHRAIRPNVRVTVAGIGAVVAVAVAVNIAVPALIWPQLPLQPAVQATVFVAVAIVAALTSPAIAALDGRRSHRGRTPEAHSLPAGGPVLRKNDLGFTKNDLLQAALVVAGISAALSVALPTVDLGPILRFDVGLVNLNLPADQASSDVLAGCSHCSPHSSP